MENTQDKSIRGILQSGINAYSYVIYAFLYLFVFAFVGVFNLAFAQWDPEVLTTAEY
jgi:hypothetical protein